MKKVISTVAALALAGALATSAFAAGSGYTKDELKAKAAEYASQAASYGVSMDQVNAAIDGLTDPASVDVAAVKAAAEKAQAALQTANSQTEIGNIVNTALAEMKAAAGNNSVEVGNVSVQLNLDGSATVKAEVKVGSATVTAEKTTAANADRAPQWTDSSNKANSTTTAATSGAAASTAGVIKATGLNTTGAAVAALAVVSVLGAAAVKARKLGE